MNKITETTKARIETTKGDQEGTIASVCRWQQRMRGGYAVVEVDIDGAVIRVDVDDVDFDADDIDEAVSAVMQRIDEAI